MSLAPKKFGRYYVYATSVVAFAFLQHQRWNHAELMRRYYGCNTIGYQIPGGLFVAITPESSSSSKELTDEERLKNRWYIDLKCQVYQRDDKLSSFDPRPFWFDMEYPKFIKTEKVDQAKP